MRAYMLALFFAPWGLGGCVEKVLQTAEQGAESAQLPTQCQGSEPPESPVFGDDPGASTNNLLVAGSYGVSEGPGISVTGRDAYRFYLNGTLVFESSEVRAPTFVPLSLAPGENVIAVAVVAASGTPAALVHLSELERDYLSNDSWKASASSEPGWSELGYDDSDWAQAVELARLGEAPGCDPESDFPASSDARWIGAPPHAAQTAFFRKTIRVEAQGFGQDTNGGGTREPLLVTTFAELEAATDSDDPQVIFISEGTYDFRKKGSEVEEIEVCPEECPMVPNKTTLRVLVSDQTCESALVTAQRDERKLSIGSNTTLVGLGRGAALRGVTLDLEAHENIIIRNIALFDINADLLEAGDAFGLTAPKRVWIDHGSVQWVSDGFTDIRDGSEGVTLSYMHYDADDEAACEEQHLWTSEISGAEVTIHHSRFDHASTRVPLVSGEMARAHLYNNVFSNISEWAVGSWCLAQVLLEGNVFENVDAATSIGLCESGERGLIDAPVGSNLYRGTSGVHLGADENEPHDSVFEVPYDYSLQTANEAWPEVISRAGTGGPWALPLVRD